LIENKILIAEAKVARRSFNVGWAYSKPTIER